MDCEILRPGPTLILFPQPGPAAGTKFVTERKKKIPFIKNDESPTPIYSETRMGCKYVKINTNLKKNLEPFNKPKTDLGPFECLTRNQLWNTPASTNPQYLIEHIELPAKLLDYFQRSNKSNINQSDWLGNRGGPRFCGPPLTNPNGAAAVGSRQWHLQIWRWHR